MIKLNKDGSLEVTFAITDEQILEAFENTEVKFSKAKLKNLIEMLSDNFPDVSEQLENALVEVLEENISDEWGN